MKFLYSLIFSLAFLTACGSRLPPSRGGEKTAQTEFDPKKITFYQLDSGEAFTLNEYLEVTEKRWLLLDFGSKGCLNCIEKMREIRDFVSEETFKNDEFELLAISADPLALRGAVQKFAVTNGFTFLKWIDDRGEMLKEWFLPEQPVGVPFVAFVADGQVLWSYDNKTKVTVGELVTRVKLTVPEESTPPPPPPPPPPPKPIDKDFDLYNGVSVKLSSLLPNAEYTIVNVFSELCLSCFDELRHWAQAKDLFDSCQKPKCQFLNLENGYPEDESVTDRYKRMKELLAPQGLDRGELLLDPKLSDNDGWKDRFFDGYLTDKFPEWGGLYGTVAYKDGKIVWREVAGDPGKVTDFVRNLQTTNRQ